MQEVDHSVSVKKGVWIQNYQGSGVIFIDVLTIQK